MNQPRIIEYICRHFDIKPKSEMIKIVDDTDVFDCLLEECICDQAKQNKGDVLVSNSIFIQRQFISRPFQFKSAPTGYKEAECFLCTPLRGYNDSFDSDYVDKVYDYIEPRLKRKYPQIAVCFENLFGKVHCCIFLDPFKFVSYGVDSAQISGIFNILRQIMNDDLLRYI